MMSIAFILFCTTDAYTSSNISTILALFAAAFPQTEYCLVLMAVHTFFLASKESWIFVGALFPPVLCHALP